MVKIITAALGQNEETHVTLLFANRTEKDILWQAELEQLQEAFTTRWADSALTFSHELLLWHLSKQLPHLLTFDRTSPS